MSPEPFVGRQPELQRLRDAFDAARDGRGGVALITGDPGIGKTRLARELERYAVERGARVFWGRAHEDEGAPPYWPWVQALRPLIETTDGDELLAWLGDGGSEVARIFPALLGRLPNLPEPEPITDPQSAQFRLFDAATTFIAGAASTVPLVVVLDDLHWADKATLQLLEHAALELGRANLLLIGTYRDVELGRQHPLEEALAGIGRAERFQTIDLRGLSEEDADAYVRATTGVEPSATAIKSIHRATEGNAFFLQEVVALMAQEGTLASGEVSVPPSVRAAVGRRLNTLSEEANQLLRIAAVVGREFSDTLLARLFDQGSEQLPELLESALDARLVEEAGAPGEYRFSHALIQETLLNEVRTAQRITLHARIAEALEALYGDGAVEHAAELAPHFVESAPLRRELAASGARYSRLAAERAAGQLAWDEAAHHYDRCLSVVSGADGHLDEDEAELLTALGRCWLLVGEVRSAWRSLLRAIEIFRARGDAVGLARATLELHSFAGTSEQIIQFTETALESLDDDQPYLRARLLAQRARPAGVVPSGDDAGERAAALAAELADEHEYADVHAELALRACVRAVEDARLEDAVSLGRAAFTALEALGAVALAAESLLWVEVALSLSGDLTAAAALRTERRAYARKTHSRTLELLFLRGEAGLALVRCDFDRFESLVDQAPDDHQILLLRMSAAELVGDAETALALVPRINLRGLPSWELEQVHAALACVLFISGDELGAREQLALWEEIRGRPSSWRISTPFAMLDECLPALGTDQQVRSALEFLNRHGEQRFTGPGAIGVDHVRGALALRLDLLEEAQQHYRTGLEWAERERCPIEAGRNHQGLAEVAIRQGQTTEALHHLDAAIALFEPHGAKLYLDQARQRQDELRATPAGRPAHPDGLSDREVAVLRLVAAGNTNAQIAETLVIAIDTVKRHVSNILRKTGLRNRTELAAYAVAQGLIDS